MAAARGGCQGQGRRPRLRGRAPGRAGRRRLLTMIGFFVIAAFAVAGAIMVVTARQPIHAALALVATLLAVAVAYITLDAHFLAAIQVIVYAGAIMVLFLFVIMLLNVERQPLAARWSWLRPTAYGVGLLALVAV